MICYDCELTWADMTQCLVWDESLRAYKAHWLCESCRQRRRQDLIARWTKSRVEDRHVGRQGVYDV